MEKIEFPFLDSEVSRIGLGTWAIGGWLWGGTDEKYSIRTIHTAFDKGVNLIDTAPVYGFGLSEQIVGKAIKQYGERDKIIIATKTGLEWKEGQKRPYRNSSKARIFKEIDDSLKRLKTDYIDIYQIHWPDPMTPIKETAEAMQTLKDQGKIRSIGVSNYSPEQMDIFRQITNVDVCQPPYNMFEREIEKDVLPYCLSNNIYTLGYSSICRGLLSGKMSSDKKFKDDDLRSSDPKFQPDRFKMYLDAVSKLNRLAKNNYERKIIHLAIRWVLDKGISVALWGARRPSQLEEIDEISGWMIEKEDMTEIDKILKTTITDPAGRAFDGPPAR